MLLLGFTSAVNGMQSLLDQNDSTANNIANVNTVGFKRERLTFKDIYDTSVLDKSQPGSDNQRTLGQLSVGSQVQKLTYDFTQGALNRTGNPFDIAIDCSVLDLEIELFKEFSNFELCNDILDD